jgi:hypothetical protein
MATDVLFYEMLEFSKQEYIAQLETLAKDLAIAHFHSPQGWDNITAQAEFTDYMAELVELRGF